MFLYYDNIYIVKAISLFHHFYIKNNQDYFNIIFCRIFINVYKLYNFFYIIILLDFCFCFLCNIKVLFLLYLFVGLFRIFSFLGRLHAWTAR